MEGGPSEQPPPVYWVAVVDIFESPSASGSNNDAMPAHPPAHLRNYYRWCQRPQKKVDIVVSSADSTSDFEGSVASDQQNQAEALATHSNVTATAHVPQREDDGPADSTVRADGSAAAPVVQISSDEEDDDDDDDDMNTDDNDAIMNVSSDDDDSDDSDDDVSSVDSDVSVSSPDSSSSDSSKTPSYYALSSDPSDDDDVDDDDDDDEDVVLVDNGNNNDN